MNPAHFPGFVDLLAWQLHSVPVLRRAEALRMICGVAGAVFAKAVAQAAGVSSTFIGLR